MKKIKYIVAFLVVVGLVVAGMFYEADHVGVENRSPAQIPNNYQESTACQKQDILWNRITTTDHTKTAKYEKDRELPEFEVFGMFQLMALGKQALEPKSDNHTDFAPQGWKKYLHARGSIAKVKLVATNNKYTGIFAGADCALLRLSLTYKTGMTPTALFKTMPVAPGLALKVLRTGASSANISALVSLSGQGENFNFFANPMSNIVPIGTDSGQEKVHKIFAKTSSYPEELLADDMAAIDQHGTEVKEISAPRQLFFVAGEDFKFSSEDHDVRNDFATIKPGTVIYKVYAAADDKKAFDYRTYSENDVKAFKDSAVHIADLITTSDFVASEFGDSGIFFRHQMRPKN